MLNAGATVSGEPSDAFAVKLSLDGVAIWATFLGGPGNDQANAIGVDSSGDVWLAGTNGAGFPTTSSWFVATAGDFLAELSPDGSKLLYSAEFPGETVGQSMDLDQAGLLHVARMA